MKLPYRFINYYRFSLGRNGRKKFTGVPSNQRFQVSRQLVPVYSGVHPVLEVKINRRPPFLEPL